MRGRARPSFGMIPIFEIFLENFFFLNFDFFSLEKWVSYQKKDWGSQTCPSFVENDNDSGHKGPFCVTQP